jgi:hypothetical protein
MIQWPESVITALAHIGRGETYFGRELRAVGMIGADRQHWNLQLTFGQEFLIVDGVLREGGELSAECMVDGARVGIQRGIVVACLLIDAGWIC